VGADYSSVLVSGMLALVRVPLGGHAGSTIWSAEDTPFVLNSAVLDEPCSEPASLGCLCHDDRVCPAARRL